MTQAEELDTETKLAILSSILENKTHEELLEALLNHEGDVETTLASLSERTSAKKPKVEVKEPREDYTKHLKWHEAAGSPKRKNASVLELHTPAQIEAALPCALFLNILDSSLAKDLLVDMLKESEHWSQGYFKLFDRTVTSPHTAGFYLRSEEEIASHRAYVYNGQPLATIHRFLPSMESAHGIIEARTREWLQTRAQCKNDYLDPDWHANVAFSNLYDGRDSSVGYHSDQLTYIGPQPTIASLSLGCEREFRLKPVSGTGRTISIRLPHNSLFIMGPGCQEDYKHSIHPVSGTRGLDLHSIAGVRRINITYRNYKAAYAPEHLPHCACGQVVLRSAKAATDNVAGPTESTGPYWRGRRYFWHCDGDKNPSGTGCGFFKWVQFDNQGVFLP